MGQTLQNALKALVIGTLTVTLATSVWAEEATTNENDETVSVSGRSNSWIEDAQDPENQLQIIEEFSEPRDGLIPFSLVQPFRNGFGDFKSELYEATGLNIGLAFHTVGQKAQQVLLGNDDSGWATDFDILGNWEILNRGTPYQGEVVFGVEGRWDYGTIGPQNIGFASLASAGGTANTFSAYSPPAFILRNLYWRQGGEEAGWVYRIGKITPDSIFSGSKHLSPNAAFLPNAGTGMFSNALPDSGLGVVGALYLGDAAYVSAVVADANGNRYDFGDLSKGDLYKAVELGLKILPITENASYSKFTLWHTDGTFDGSPINANTGNSGWGYSIVLQQELTADGNLVFVGRYGQSFDKAAIFDKQVGAHLVWYQPFDWFDTDSIGVAINWIDSASQGSRHETNFEAFYKFPLFPDVETTFSYQHVKNPANTTALNSSNVFSFRITTAF